jgi:hypothetical protein
MLSWHSLYDVDTGTNFSRDVIVMLWGPFSWHMYCLETFFDLCNGFTCAVYVMVFCHKNLDLDGGIYIAPHITFILSWHSLPDVAGQCTICIFKLLLIIVLGGGFYYTTTITVVLSWYRFNDLGSGICNTPNSYHHNTTTTIITIIITLIITQTFYLCNVMYCAPHVMVLLWCHSLP